MKIKIKEYPDYYIDDEGNINSHKFGKVKRLKYSKDTNGYYNVNLSKKGIRKIFCVHRLVLEAFISPCPVGMEACHNDGNKENNNLSNLRWDTHKNNFTDIRKHGKVCYGSNNGRAKLTDIDIAKIRISNEKVLNLAKQYKVSIDTIYKVKGLRTWKHLQWNTL